MSNLSEPLQIVVFGLSITSSWGNGHATTYRALLKALAARGHRVLFLERDVPWYANNRDLPNPPYCKTILYASLDDVKASFEAEVAESDLVLIGSYVPEGAALATWAIDVARGVTAFYDIDTPVTLAKLARHENEYLSADLIPRFDLYLSFTGGPMLDHLESQWGAQRAKPLFCCVDSDLYFPEARPIDYDLGYLGTYSIDRQPTLDRLLIEPARREHGRFCVAGPQYPREIDWPTNVERIEHLPPVEHRAFYNRQRFTLNVTRGDMIRTGFSPSVRLFEAAACGVPVISDSWPGIETFFEPDHAILLARTPDDIIHYLKMSDVDRCAIGTAARMHVLAHHTSVHRALELEAEVRPLLRNRRGAATKGYQNCPATHVS